MTPTDASTPAHLRRQHLILAGGEVIQPAAATGRRTECDRASFGLVAVACSAWGPRAAATRRCRTPSSVTKEARSPAAPRRHRCHRRLVRPPGGSRRQPSLTAIQCRLPMRPEGSRLPRQPATRRESAMRRRSSLSAGHGLPRCGQLPSPKNQREVAIIGDFLPSSAKSDGRQLPRRG